MKKFKDIKIRKTLSYAINRQELVDILFFWLWKSLQWVPFLPDSFAYNEEVETPKQDIEMAKKTF